MNEAYNDGIPESESNVYRLDDHSAYLGRDCVVFVEDRQTTHVAGKPIEKGISA